MGLTCLQEDWTTKPPIGTPLRGGHWSVQGLVGAWVFNECGGTVAFNVADSSKNAVLPSLTNSRILTIKGLVLDDVLTTQRVTFPAEVSNGATDLTVVARVTPRKKFLGNNTSWVCKSSGGTGSSVSWVLGGNWNSTSSDYYPWFLVGIGSSNYVVAHATQWNVGITETFSGVRKGSDLLFYRNGKLVNTTSGIPTTAVNSNSTVGMLGDYLPNDSLHTIADYQFVYIYTRALSAEENRSIVNNPWQIFEPETVWADSSAVAGVPSEASVFSAVGSISTVGKKLGSSQAVTSGIGGSTEVGEKLANSSPLFSGVAESVFTASKTAFVTIESSSVGDVIVLGHNDRPMGTVFSSGVAACDVVGSKVITAPATLTGQLADTYFADKLGVNSLQSSAELSVAASGHKRVSGHALCWSLADFTAFGDGVHPIISEIWDTQSRITRSFGAQSRLTRIWNGQSKLRNR